LGTKKVCRSTGSIRAGIRRRRPNNVIGRDCVVSDNAAYGFGKGQGMFCARKSLMPSLFRIGEVLGAML